MQKPKLNATHSALTVIIWLGAPDAKIDYSPAAHDCKTNGPDHITGSMKYGIKSTDNMQEIA